MNFQTTTRPLSQIQTDLLIVPLFEDAKELEPKAKELNRALGEEISDLISRGDFKPKLAETQAMFTGKRTAAKRVLLLGLGKQSEYNLEKARTAMSAAAPVAQKFKVNDIAIALIKTLPSKVSVESATQALTEGILLANYKFTEYKKRGEEEKPAALTQIQFVLSNSRDKTKVLKAATVAHTLSQAANYARDLGNHPGNVATPQHLAKHALDLAKQHSKILKAKVLGKGDLQKESMGAVLAVAQGSDEEPKFIVLEYHAEKKAPTVVLAGKGITFDSGGISIKPSEKMEEMKYDMAGGATVLATIKAACELRLPINLVGLIPATENLPSGKAIKPGDIVRSRAGLTIEVVNTDAEGRMVLADALDYAKKYKPVLVIDFATLTGAIVVALGDDLIGAFTNQERLVPQLKNAAQITGEQIWLMPLYKEYEQFIKSDFADLRNVGAVPRQGDAVNAALFLQNFVSYPWIHLDIAGVAWTTREKPYRPKGATGVGVRLALEFLKNFKHRR
ncbi:MAG: leucyl aminopeptidase [Candidatus Doudnabacteria bacterium]|nr:leucyl aminopeptidase [Candidatus Doudnabacteria bacterium]